MIVTLCAVAGARAQDAHPPRLLEVEARPSATGEQAVDLTIEVSADGRARVVSCEGSPADCDVAREVVEHGRFAPARAGDEAIGARVSMRYVFAAPGPAAHVLAPPQAPPEPAPESERTLGVTARVQARPQTTHAPPGTTHLSLAEARDQPGALGDPFRALGSLPGLVPILYGFPYYFVRGAPPQGTVYTYDSIPLPALFHVLALPSVIHPRMLGDLQLHRGVAPARWGRHTGGIVAGAGPGPIDTTVGEAELRMLDVSGFVAVREGDVRVAAATRIGYPGYFVGLVVPGGYLSYWDYQLRASVHVGGGTRVELVSIGAHDVLSLPSSDVPGTDSELTFHRGELRLVHRSGATEVGGALRYGADYAAYAERDRGSPLGISLELGLAGARTWIASRGESFEVRAGAEWISRFGTYGRLGDSFVVDPLLSTLSGSRNRTHGSVFLELALLPFDWLRLELGGRTDVYLGAEGTLGSADPRLRITAHVSEHWDVSAAVGTAHAPAVWSLPTPGFSELPIALGLQSAVQSELAVRWADENEDASLRGRLEVAAFANRQEDILPPLLLQVEEVCDDTRCLGTTDIRMDQWALGLEALLRGTFAHHLDAQLAYTFTWIDADPVLSGIEFAPPWDIRHVWSLLVGYDSRDGLTIGARGFLRSGSARNYYWVELPTGADSLVARHTVQRLPWFGTLDVSIAYAWDAGWARLRVSAEFLNATFALGGEPAQIMCAEGGGPPTGCETLYAVPIFLPNAGLRATFD